jgi:hypothetical protein
MAYQPVPNDRLKGLSVRRYGHKINFWNNNARVSPERLLRTIRQGLYLFQLVAATLLPARPQGAFVALGAGIMRVCASCRLVSSDFEAPGFGMIGADAGRIEGPHGPHVRLSSWGYQGSFANPLAVDQTVPLPVRIIGRNRARGRSLRQAAELTR